MTFYTSGDWIVDKDYETTFDVFKFMCEQYSEIVSELPFDEVDIEVNQTDLSEENSYGFCQIDGNGEFLIHIHNNLVPTEYAVTLMHELIHVRQTLEGLFDYDRREEEAVIWEDILSKEFWDSYGSGTFFSTPWTHTVYNKKVKQENHE